MIKAVRGWAAAVFAASMLGLGAGETAAAPIDTSGYATSEVLLDEVIGYAFADGTGFFQATDFFVSIDVVGFGGIGTAVSLAADTDGVSGNDLGFASAAQVSVMEQIIEFLFEDGAIGYLVTVDATGSARFFDSTDLVPDQVDFVNHVDFNADALISLERLSTPVIPLPAGLPLLVGALGTLAVARRIDQAISCG